MSLSLKKRRRTPPGAAPGTLIADPGAQKTQIEFIAYGPDSDPGDASKKTIDSIEDLPPKSEKEVRWINVIGLRDTAIIEQIGQTFNLHALALEDILNVHQRPKVEAYDDHLFIVTRMPLNPPDSQDNHTSSLRNSNGPAPWADPAGRLETEQVSLCLGRDYIITFQEQPGDVFEPVRNRLRNPNGRIRARRTDYLAYALLDAVIDSFFPVLEAYGERVENLEMEVVAQPEFGHISHIHGLKRDLLTARRAVWPQREMLNSLIRDESSFIHKDTRIYLRDCYDHTIQLIDMLETYREIASGLVDIQLSSTSNRMNEVMKVLTIIATIFIPLTFIAGVYGMNFDPEASPWNMPELHWRYGYPASLLLMAAIGISLLFWFRKKGWIGNA